MFVALVTNHTMLYLVTNPEKNSLPVRDVMLIAFLCDADSRVHETRSLGLGMSIERYFSSHSNKVFTKYQNICTSNVFIHASNINKRLTLANVLTTIEVPVFVLYQMLRRVHFTID